MIGDKDLEWREFSKEEVEARKQAFKTDRKEFKKNAHKVVRSHYVFLFFICLIIAFMGTEFNDSTGFLQTGSRDNAASSGSGVVARSGAEKVYNDIANNRIERGRKAADKNIEQARKNDKKGSVVGRRNGVFALIVNQANSGKIFITIVSAIRSITKSGKIASYIFILLGLFISLFIYFFISNMMRAISRRLFLEARTYEHVPIHHFMWFRAVHKWVNVAVALAITSIFQALWDLTIIGGIIKAYSYQMVPFIMAENPGMKPMEAITLSRQMMYGHKLESFRLDVTMLGWFILGTITLGISDIFYGIMYRLAVQTEYYVYVRKDAKEANIYSADLLNDKYLYEKAPEELLRRKYYDVETEAEYIEDHTIELPKWRQFLIDNFSIWLGSSEEKKAYQDVEGRKYYIRREQDILKGFAYPGRLNPLADPKQAKLSGSTSFLRSYTVWSVILMFFIFAFAGWIWEVSLHLVNEGTFVNRGTLHGPWLPIYGYGGTFILILLTRFRKNPLLEFITAVVLSGIVEYVTAWSLETSKGMKWWDYSGYFLNLHGRICAEGLLVFGIGGMIVVYALAPLLDDLIEKLPGRVAMLIALGLLSVYLVDYFYSQKHPNVGEGITSYVDGGSSNVYADGSLEKGLGNGALSRVCHERAASPVRFPRLA